MGRDTSLKVCDIVNIVADNMFIGIGLIIEFNDGWYRVFVNGKLLSFADFELHKIYSL